VSCHLKAGDRPGAMPRGTEPKASPPSGNAPLTRFTSPRTRPRLRGFAPRRAQAASTKKDRRGFARGEDRVAFFGCCEAGLPLAPLILGEAKVA